jgi:hypothetical protein
LSLQRWIIAIALKQKNVKSRKMWLAEKKLSALGLF